MHSKILPLIIAGGILASTAASAKVPVLLVPTLSGAYAVSYTEICQGNLSGTSPGSVSVESVTATFAPHTLTIAGTKTSGDLVIPKGLAGGTFFQNPVSKSYKYSNDMTTLTMGGATFNIVYGTVFNRVAQSFVFSGPSNAGCAVSATGFHQ
jgi:hypothetical protein